MLQRNCEERLNVSQGYVVTTELKMTEWKRMVALSSSSQSSFAAMKNVLTDGMGGCGKISKENYEQVEWQFKNKTHYGTNLVRIIKTRDKFIL